MAETPIGGMIFGEPPIPPSAETLLEPALYTDADSIYAASVTAAQTLSPALYTDADTFYAPTILRGALTLTAVRYDDADTFYAPTILRGALTLTAVRYDDADSFYAPSVTRGVRTLTVPLFDDTPDTFYQPAVTGEELILFPQLLTDADTFYALSIYRIKKLTPDADISDGSWTNEVDSNVNLYASIDEATANDGDYIKSSDQPTNDIVKIGLSDPGISLAQPFKVKYRYKKDAASGTMDLTVRLMEGVTQIATWTHSDISTSFVDAEQELTLGEFNAITDVNDLNVEFEADWAA